MNYGESIYNGIVKEQSHSVGTAMELSPGCMVRLGAGARGKKFTVCQCLFFKKKEGEGEKCVCGYMCVYLHTHKYILNTSVHMPRTSLGGYTETWRPWLRLGRGVGIIFHCIPFVPYEFCTMYMYYRFKK